MNRTAAVGLLSGLALASPGMSPNVIVVMTDDQGYGEMSCHGNPVLQTPHLDRLHDSSLRLTDYHAAPMCTPSRGQFLTGCDAVRNGAVNVSSGRTLVRAGLPTIADVFAGAGYQTGLFGKWHLGDNYPFRPQDRGFHEMLWFPSSHINSVPDTWNNDYLNDTYIHNGAKKEYAGYCTDVFFDESMKWMKQCSAEDQPFFVYLALNAPHSPHWVPQKYCDIIETRWAEGVLPDLKEKVRAKITPYLAMIQNIDENIGRLESFLSENGLTENTILVFTTDNGSTYGYLYYKAGMRGRKVDLWEGGHRVPFFLRWPGGNLGAPRDIAGLTEIQDVLPTLADLCGIPVPENLKPDGITLTPALKSTGSVPKDRMLVINYSRMPFGFDYPSPDSPSLVRKEGAAVMWKRWRLLQETELYDLEKDPFQKKNVIQQYPEVAKQMQRHLDEWWAELGPAANDPQRVTIGHENENPCMLTACEWMDVFVDMQQQVRRGERKNSWWELEVAQDGVYEIELRRWPRESGLALCAVAPATDVAFGTLVQGEALPIARARILMDGQSLKADVLDGDECATFTVPLKKGPVRLHTWFDDENGEPICGAYYVYVNRK